MVERHVSFDVLPGKWKDFEKFFSQEYAPAMSRQPGFLRVSLLREVDVPTAYKMVIAFETADLATAWRASDDHKALSPRLKSMYSESRVTVYEVVVRTKQARLR
jgi:heme-degrading monooxygenase HmoA